MVRKKLFFYLIIFLGIEAVLFGALFWGKEQAEKQHLESVLVHHQGEYEASIADLGRLARFAAQESFGRPEVVALFAQAAQASGPERDRLRSAMYTLLLPSYQNLSQEYFRQIHYHFADGTSFLRLHKPERFGDSLFALRPSVRLANTEQRLVEGFEVGRGYHAFRHVFPLQQAGQHLGTVEVSAPFAVLSKALRRAYPEEYGLILKRELLRERLLPTGLDKYAESGLAKDYLQGKNDFAADLDGHDNAGHLDKELIARINKAIAPQIADRLAAGKSFAEKASVDGHDYLLVFLPVVEVNGQTAGFLVSYGTEPSLAFIRYGFFFALVMATVLLVLLFGLHWRSTRKIFAQLNFQQQMMDAIPIPICLKDLAGVFTSCNQAFAKLCGLPRAKIIGQTNASIFAPEVVSQQQALDKKVISTAEKQQEEMRMASADEISRDLLVVKAPFVDEQGRVVGVVGSAIDITAQKESAAEIEKSRAELDQIFNTAANGMWVVANDYTVLRVNDTFCALTGLRELEIIGRKCHEVFPGAACQTDACPLASTLHTPRRVEAELTKLLPSGRRLEVAITSHPHYGINGEMLGIIEDFKDITRYKEMEQHLRDLAITDELTGLFNRRGFLALAENQLDNALRTEYEAFLIFADLDNMKTINDTLGHEAGDLALVTAAELLRLTFRQADVLARLGGDEFAIFISCKTGTDSEQAILARLEASIFRKNLDGELPFAMAISFGVAQLQKDETLEQVMIRADGLMYNNKLRKREAAQNGEQVPFLAAKE